MARKTNRKAKRTTSKRRKNTSRRTNHHLSLGSMVSYKGHKAKIARQHDGDSYTIRFESTGKKMVVRGSTLKRANGASAYTHPDRSSYSGLAVRQNRRRSKASSSRKSSRGSRKRSR